MSLATQKATCDGCGKKIEHDEIHYFVQAHRVIPNAKVQREMAAYAQAEREHRREYERVLEESGPIDMNDPEAVERAGLTPPPEPPNYSSDVGAEFHFHEQCFKGSFASKE